jgi:hypothetical protein
VPIKGKAAGATPGRDDLNLMTGRAGRSDRMRQIIGDVGALQPKLARQPRYRAGLIAEQSEQVFSEHDS